MLCVRLQLPSLQNVNSSSYHNHVSGHTTDGSLDDDADGVEVLERKEHNYTEAVCAVEWEVKKWMTPLTRTPFGGDTGHPSGCWALVQSVDVGAVMTATLSSCAEELDESVKHLHRRFKNPSYPPPSESKNIRLHQQKAFSLGKAMVMAGNFMMRMNDCGEDDPWYQKSLAIHMIMNEEGTEAADAAVATL